MASERLAAAWLRLGLWLCRHGCHFVYEPGNCVRCGFRSHGGHIAEYAQWKEEGRVR